MSDPLGQFVNLAKDLTRDAQDAFNNALGAQGLLGQAVDTGQASWDIVNDYKWSLASGEQAKALTPKIIIKLLEMRTGQLSQLLSQSINTVVDPYKGIYNLDLVTQLNLPYFSEFHHTNSHSWEPLSLESLASNLGQGAQALYGAATLGRSLAAAIAVPGYKTETPYIWKDTNLEAVTVNFNLYNSTEKDYIKNKKFIDTMVYWTLPRKLKATFALPPVLCEYEIPGIRRGLIARVDFTVASKGQITFHDNTNVPDAYNVVFTLTDLLMQTRNIHSTNGPGGLNSSIDGSGATTVYGG